MRVNLSYCNFLKTKIFKKSFSCNIGMYMYIYMKGKLICSMYIVYTVVHAYVYMCIRVVFVMIFCSSFSYTYNIFIHDGTFKTSGKINIEMRFLF